MEAAAGGESAPEPSPRATATAIDTIAAATSANARPAIMAGLLDRKQLAVEVGYSERTVIRWERAGMPFIRLGMLRLYETAKVREWLLSHEYRTGAPGEECPDKKAA